MAEEVVIRVRQESQGNALSETAQKMEALKAKIAELNRLEKTYTEKGLPTAAATTRTERIPYARELRDLQREERAAAKAAAREHINTQKEVTAEVRRQRREQEAVEKARTSFGKRLATGAVRLAERELGAGSLGGLPTAAVGALAGAGPAGLAAAVGVAVASAVAAVAIKGTQFYLGQKDQDTALANQIGEERLRGNRGLGRLERYGTAGQAFGESQGLQEKVAALTAHGQTLRDQAHEGITGRIDKFLGTEFFTKGFGFYKPKSARAIEANEKERQEKQELLNRTKAVNRELFGIGPGQELAEQHARVEGRYKEAIAIGAAAEAFRRYQQLKTQGGTAEEARDGANLVLRQREIDARRGLGGLAGPRSGRANLAALASLGQNFSTADSVARLDQLIAVVERGQAQYGTQSALQTHRR